jgi:hypothetical protein
MRAEPKTILAFLHKYFDSINQLFEVQKKDGIIRKEILQEIFNDQENNIKSQLLEYKILKSQGGDYELRKTYFDFLAFILSDFQLDLPQSIQKYDQSISEIFHLIVTESDKDKNILVKRLYGLSEQIKEFMELVEANTDSLLNETKALKANMEKFDYMAKVQKASFWIEYYINPLNNILDVNHSQSISKKLYDIANYANEKRLYFEDINIQLEFEKLYSFLLNINEELLFQSKILTKELLPLLDRIKTESQTLSGFITLLRRPEKYPPPPLLDRKRDYPYNKHIFLNTKEYFEQYQEHESIYINNYPVEQELWIFNKIYFKNKLNESLPVDDFFNWCSNILKEEFEQVEIKKLFHLWGLMFDKDYLVDFENIDSKYKIKTDGMMLTVPKIKINFYELSQKP